MLDFLNSTKKELAKLKKENSELVETNFKLMHINKAIEQPPEYAARIADLEVKMAKLWGLLVETTPAKKEKLTKYGKMFGGKARDSF